MLSADLIESVFPRCTAPQRWAEALNPAFAKYGITTVPRISSFLAQTGYESDQFNRLTENLKFTTAKRLMAVWPKRFPTESSAAPYVANEMRLGNFVYANRLGNGDVRSGDGYRYPHCGHMEGHWMHAPPTLDALADSRRADGTQSA